MPRWGQTGNDSVDVGFVEQSRLNSNCPDERRGRNQRGLDAALVDYHTENLHALALAADFLSARDPFGEGYVRLYRKTRPPKVQTRDLAERVA